MNVPSLSYAGQTVCNEGSVTVVLRDWVWRIASAFRTRVRVEITNKSTRKGSVA